jgi:hypothetical protein
MRPRNIVAAAAGLAATAALVLTLSRVPAKDEPARAGEIQRLIAQLGSGNYKEREAAGKRLEALGEPAWVALRQTAAATRDLEIRLRAERLAHIIAQRVFVEVRRFTGHSDGVITLAVSPNGKLALSGAVCYQSKDGAARLWDVANGRLRHKLEGPTGGVYGVAFLPGGKRAVTGGADGTLRLWDVKAGKEVKRLVGHAGTVYGLAVAPDGKSIVTGGEDGTVRLWDVATGKEVRRFLGHTDKVRAVAFAADGKRVLSRAVFSDPSVRLWDVSTGKEIARLPAPASSIGTYGTAGIALSPHGKLAAAAGQDNLARLWDLATGKEVRRLEGHAGEVDSLAFSADGKRLLTGGEDGTVRLWDVATGREVHRFHGHANRVWSVAFTPDGRHALSASFDRTLRLWRLPP